MMPRVASLYLPELAIERLRPKPLAPPPEPVRHARPVPDLPPAQAGECSVPRGSGWRPGARWAREELQAEVDALPRHQQPPIRELGRRSEALPAPFRRDLPDQKPLGAERSVGSPPEPPLVLAARDGQKLVVAAACPAARAHGIAPGTALTFARAMVPGLGVRDADPAGDTALLDRLAILAARRWSPAAARDGGDGLWLDMSAAHLFGGEARLAARILRFLARRGFTGRIAVADAPGAAHALARHAARPLTLCPPGASAATVAELPVEALRIEPVLAASLRRLGIEQIGTLAAMPRAPLVRRFGRGLATRLDQALGRAPEPIEPVLLPETPHAACRFVEPIATAEAILTALTRLTGELCETLGQQGRGARRVGLACRLVDGSDQIAAIGTARATRDPAHLLRLLSPRIETIDPGFGIEAMRLAAFATDRLAAEPVAGDLAVADPAPDLAPLIDILAGRIGARALRRLGSVESDVPERSVVSLDPLARPAGWPPHWPRPIRILQPAEPVTAIAELPDQPPRRFTWRGETYRVAHADGPERIHGEWWRRAAEGDAVRDYFQVEDEAGRRFWLYRRGDGSDGRTGDLSWWLQGAFG